MPDNLPICTLAVPCYNEAQRLHAEEFAAFVAGEPRVHLLFVNDGSTDATLATLNALAARNGRQMSVLDQQPNAGKAEAVRRGMLQAAS